MVVTLLPQLSAAQTYSLNFNKRSNRMIWLRSVIALANGMCIQIPLGISITILEIAVTIGMNISIRLATIIAGIMTPSAACSTQLPSVALRNKTEN